MSSSSKGFSPSVPLLIALVFLLSCTLSLYMYAYSTNLLYFGQTTSLEASSEVHASLPSATYATLDVDKKVQITYPDVFNNISFAPSGDSIIFGPQKIGGYQISIASDITNTKDALAKKSALLGEGYWFSQGLQTTQNGYIGEIFSWDARLHPEAKVNTCAFEYRYFIPLANEKDEVVLAIHISLTEKNH